MDKDVFDRVARDYERIHNRSLPPGMRSDEFVRQKAESIAAWIRDGYRQGDFCYLDFGCGNGRLFKALAESVGLQPLLYQGRLRLFGYDPSRESIKEAKAISDPHKVWLVNDLNELPPSLRFDLVISCNVFHHIPPPKRELTVKRLYSRMKPDGRLVIWEHNPFNPFTRMIVKACPFDRDARLLKRGETKTLFERNSFEHVGYAYVNVFPPRWRQHALFAVIEKRLMYHPLGAQYWVMFAKNE